MSGVYRVRSSRFRLVLFAAAPFDAKWVTEVFFNFFVVQQNQDQNGIRYRKKRKSYRRDLCDVKKIPLAAYA